MSTWVRRLAAAALLTLAGLSAFAAPIPPDAARKPSDVVWNAENGGLKVSITADRDLNFAYGSSLSLTICLYQLSDTAKFAQTASSADGVASLLSGRADILGGAAKSCLVMRLQPGDTIEKTFDRMEGARYFAVAAGYAHQDPGRCSAAVPFPVKRTVRRKKKYYSAGKLAAQVSLGADAVTITGGEYE